MTEQWQELKETIIELRDNDGTYTQQEVCRFLVSYMDILEKQISEDEEQIKVGTKVRTIKDKDFTGEEVFPVQTIGVVEEIRKGEKLPYKIRANLEYWYYSRDMFDVIEDGEPQGDLISREEVLMCLTGKNLQNYELDELIAMFSKRIKGLPSVNPTKTGHWIYKQYGGYPEQGDYHCSECDKIDNNIPLYCPKCGAKMVEPQEGEG